MAQALIFPDYSFNSLRNAIGFGAGILDILFLTIV
jgi:hypothetical protein